MLKDILNEQGITVYRLSKDTGIPYSTVIDLVSGKTSIENSSSNVLYRLSKYLKLSMETIYKSNQPSETIYLYNEGTNVFLRYGNHVMQYLGPKNLVGFHKINRVQGGMIHVDTYYYDTDNTVYSEEEYVPYEEVFEDYDLKQILPANIDVKIGKPDLPFKDRLVNDSLLVSDSMCVTYQVGSAGDIQIKIVNLNRPNQRMILRLKDMVILQTNMSQSIQERAINAVKRNSEYIRSVVDKEVLENA